MSTPSANLSVLVGKDFACVKIAGRANFMSSPDFKTLLTGLNQKGYHHFIVGFVGMRADGQHVSGHAGRIWIEDESRCRGRQCDIELLNPSARVAELLENLGVLPLFKVTTGAVQLPDDAKASAPTQSSPRRQEITRTCLEAHQTLDGRQPGKRRALQGRDAVSGRRFEEPAKSRREGHSSRRRRRGGTEAAGNFGGDRVLAASRAAVVPAGAPMQRPSSDPATAAAE